MDPPHHMMLNRKSSSSPIDVHTQGGTSKTHHKDMGDNPHYPSLVPPSIPSTRLVILWDVLLGNSIFSQVLKNLASPSEIQSSLPRLEYLTPCHYLPGRKLIADASPAITQFPQPRPGKIAIATTSPSI